VEIGCDEHTRGRKGGEVDTVVCSAWPATEPFSENSGADMSSARSSMADVRPRAARAPRVRGREREGVEGVGRHSGAAQACQM
jgi:hypothetical protein